MGLVVRPCSKGGGFEAFVSGLDLSRVSVPGFDVLVRTDYVAVFKRGGVRLSVYKSGKLLVFGVNSVEEAESIFRLVVS